MLDVNSSKKYRKVGLVCKASAEDVGRGPFIKYKKLDKFTFDPSLIYIHVQYS